MTMLKKREKTVEMETKERHHGTSQKRRGKHLNRIDVQNHDPRKISRHNTKLERFHQLALNVDGQESALRYMLLK